MLKLKIQFFADAGDSGAAADAGTVADAGAASETANNSAEGGQNADDGKKADNNSVDELNAEIARLKAEMAKQKAALDKATHEASQANKALKAKMTQEEIAAKEKEEADEKAAQELAELRKKVARAEATKTVMSKLSMDEEAAGNLADCLYGAADVENALLEIQKAWQAREAALRKEFGRVTGPGAGADSNSPEARAVRQAAELGKERKAQNEKAQKALDAYMR
jgi:uncharacterized small protein (DUF1192 family)